MKIAMLAPIAWRTPPRHYGPWELVTSLLTEELVKMGLDVTLFATGDSVTRARLKSVCAQGYEEDPETDAKVAECLHISNCMEQSAGFDIIHNQFDFLPLTYSRFISTPMVTTIHGFSSPRIIPVYQKYNAHNYYVSISFSNRHPSLQYIGNVYHGIDLNEFYFEGNPSAGYLLFMGRIHPDKGAHDAIKIARKAGIKLILAGIVQDEDYFENEVRPYLNDSTVRFIGSTGGAQKIKLMQNALALLHPISFEEPFGLSVVESMACGTPVIAYRKGSMPELIEDGKTGFLVTDADMAVEAVKKIARIDRTNCRKIVSERFSSEIMARNYLAIYRKILDR